ncbi:MAG: PAS domain S-box protein [Aphanothece sp. CMT-3BRIN-NPC111]|jgi:PAS domain S-box-containing protein|nr:PAS domain S-box protein [Aphanothece sp. CMT-3BRIN-NPC111]
MTLLRVAQEKFKHKLPRAFALPLRLMLILAGVLLWQLGDMKTGRCEYIVTSNKNFLEPYRQASTSIDWAFNDASRLISHNPTKNPHFTRWQCYVQQIIYLSKQGGADQAYTTNAQSKQRIDTIRGQVAPLIQTEHRQRLAQTQIGKNITWLVIGSSISLTIGVATLILFFTRRQLMAVSENYRHALASYQEQTKALRESEELKSLLVEGVKDYAIFMLDPNGYIVSWNAGAERIKGYRPEEIIGQHFSRFFTAEDIEQGKPERELQVAAAAGRFEEEGWRVRKDGSQFWANVLITALRDKAGSLSGFAKVTRDITERKGAEEALRESEQRFRATFEQAAVGIAHVSTDGQWLMVNQKLCDIVGYTREELLKLTFQDITYPDDLDSDLAYVRKVLADEIQAYSMEKRYIRKDASLIWINLTVSLVREPLGEPKYFISVIEDINNRKQAELALHSSTQRLETLQQIDRTILAAQSLKEIVHAALSRMSRFVFSEQSFVVLFDFENSEAHVVAEKLTGNWQLLQNATLPITDFIPAEVLKVKTEQEKLENEESDVLPFAFFLDYPPILQRQGGEGMGSYISLPLFAGEEFIGELILATSQRAAFNSQHLQIVSEVANQIAIAIHQAQLREQLQRKAAELEQRVAERTAELQEANAELEAFAYSVSHDLRAPLRAMQGFSQALLEDYADQMDSLGQEYAQRISGAAQRMETLIQELLAYSSLGRTEMKLQPVNLASVVRYVITQIEDEFRERQVLVTLEEEGLQMSVLAHRTTLVQVITNLLTNAVKFVASDVQPQVRLWAEERYDNLLNSSAEEVQTGREELPPNHPKSSSAFLNFNMVRLWIEDNGIGINLEHQDRIFRVFERLHGIETYPGNGIGLAIVRKGIERMGGRVGVHSEVAQGSRFWIELPKAEKQK